MPKNILKRRMQKSRAQTKITHRCSTARQRLGPPARPQFFFIQKSLSAARRGFFYRGSFSICRRPAPRSGRTVPYRRRRNFRAARFLLFRPPLRPSFSVRFPLYWFSVKKECKKNSEKKIKKSKKNEFFLQLGVDTFLIRVYIHYHRRAGLLHGSNNGV